MLRVKVHNLITGQRYEFTAADQAEIDARLERKAGVYGRAAWTETIPAWTQVGVWSGDPPVYDPEAVLEHPEVVIEHPTQHEVVVEDMEPELRAARLAVAWAAANEHAASGMDANSRTSVLWLAADPACPSWRRDRILAVQAWWAAVWAHYAAVRAQIQAGVAATYDPQVAGDCPWTIWQIANETP